ncbi:nuclear transport factor 2 family protein [Streptomyces sp. TRM68367]|uniref:nuclear transport factor 2 family protein n=1 Tax=Streptomyces sp. TRM68367 TaxID=2758415 RepID=UPI00165A283D|nr:nuclear transport factor 2 family protein [Streptomyces sp. TRM68367]MBC9729162.1 nuclear transport factor 2 family protein [Streptomyces sp. TRM68367]
MPYRPLMSALALAALLLAGCSEGSEQADSPPGTTRQATPDGAKETTGQAPDDTVNEDRKDTTVDPAAQAYVDAVAAKDLDALVDAFHSDAQLVDVGREFTGHDEIRDWARDEVIGGRLTVLKNTPKSNGTTLLVRFAPGGTGGFEANYEFDVRDGRIARLNLQYA